MSGGGLNEKFQMDPMNATLETVKNLNANEDTEETMHTLEMKSLTKILGLPAWLVFLLVCINLTRCVALIRARLDGDEDAEAPSVQGDRTLSKRIQGA